MQELLPLVILAVAAVLWLAYRFSGVRRRLLRRKAAHLLRRAGTAASPRERRELMLRLSELGALRESRKALERRVVREQGRQARTRGRPKSANPHGTSLWGKGRAWKEGWRSVDRNIRWIRKHRA